MPAENVYRHFYRTLRLGAAELSDGGGPFGFDVTTALEFDFLIERYQCDAIIETGCNAGDTTDYLARAYPVDDFNIGNPRFGYDSYDDVECGPGMLAKFADKIPVYYTNNPEAQYELPCLQPGRRGGKAYFPVGQQHDHLRHHGYFKRYETPRTATR